MSDTPHPGPSSSAKLDDHSIPTSSKAVGDDEKESKEGNSIDPDVSKTELEASNDEGNNSSVVMTMYDVLEDENDLEEDARAVLGPADDEHCTYSQGYMKRQPLYACMTCNPSEPGENNEAARIGGICLACSYECHEDHDLVELYTKRHFRCDCGNSAFRNNPCKLEPQKEESNTSNRYNQNFRGVYCICHRPYPDPEDDVMDEMIQCVICEDWYHGRHLGLPEKLPEGHAYSEMICINCVEKHSFLMAYEGMAVKLIKGDDSDEKANVVIDGNFNDSAEGKSKDDTNACRVQLFKKSKDIPIPSTLFMTKDWRGNLCKCDQCTQIYEKDGLEFLLDEEDTVMFYESQGRQKDSHIYEEGLKALSGVNRIGQIEAIQSYNEMKERLSEYLKKFADNGKVVRQEDIDEFFEEMKTQKRQKVEIPWNCK